MTTYVSKPTEVEARQWHDWPNTIYLDGEARRIVAWVNDNGGEARYEHCSSTEHEHSDLPRIAVRTKKDGWAYAAPGHYIVMGSGTFVAPCLECGSVATQHRLHCVSRPGVCRLRDFYPVTDLSKVRHVEHEWEPKS